MSVRKIFTEFNIVQDWDGKHILVFFILEKHYVFLMLWVHTNKNRPFTVPNYLLFLPFMSNSYEVFNLLPLAA